MAREFAARRVDRVERLQCHASCHVMTEDTDGLKKLLHPQGGGAGHGGHGYAHRRASGQCRRSGRAVRNVRRHRNPQCRPRQGACRAEEDRPGRVRNPRSWHLRRCRLLRAGSGSAQVVRSDHRGGRRRLERQAGRCIRRLRRTLGPTRSWRRTPRDCRSTNSPDFCRRRCAEISAACISSTRRVT